MARTCNYDLDDELRRLTTTWPHWLRDASMAQTAEFRRISSRADALRCKPRTAMWPAAAVGLMRDLERLAATVSGREIR